MDGPTRFARFAFVLCDTSLCPAEVVYRFVSRKMAGSLIRIDKREEQKIDPFKHWFFRPMQGIGIGLILARN